MVGGVLQTLLWTCLQCGRHLSGFQANPLKVCRGYTVCILEGKVSLKGTAVFFYLVPQGQAGLCQA